MFRRKRSPARKEVPVAASLKRSLTLSDSLYCICDGSAVHKCLRRKKPSLAQVIIFRRKSPHVASASHTDQRVQRVIGKVLTPVDVVRVIRNLMGEPAVTGDQGSCESCEWQNPLDIAPPESRGRGPKRHLILREVF